MPEKKQLDRHVYIYILIITLAISTLYQWSFGKDYNGA